MHRRGAHRRDGGAGSRHVHGGRAGDGAGGRRPRVPHRAARQQQVARGDQPGPGPRDRPPGRRLPARARPGRFDRGRTRRRRRRHAARDDRRPRGRARAHRHRPRRPEIRPVDRRRGRPPRRRTGRRSRARAPDGPAFAHRFADPGGRRLPGRRGGGPTTAGRGCARAGDRDPRSRLRRRVRGALHGARLHSAVARGVRVDSGGGGATSRRRACRLPASPSSPADRSSARPG